MTVIPFINEDVAAVAKRANDRIRNPKAQRAIVLVIVCIALLLDNMLYMVIVPIIPEYLRSIGAWTEIVAPVSWTVDANGTNVTMPPGVTRYEGESVAVGMLFASKALIQLFISPCAGYVIDRIGYDLPMMFGLTVMFLSTAIFAFGKSYGVLFFARSLQGVGSGFADTGGLAMIADRYTEEVERTRALGLALACISFGSLVAPPFGGILYEFAGKKVPFLILSTTALLDGFLLLLVMRPVKQAELLERLDKGAPDRPAVTPIWRLITDPYIALCAGALCMSNVPLAFLEPTIALWMEATMTDVNEWQIGMVWLPAFVPYICSVYLTVYLARRYPQYQWIIAIVGLAMEGVMSFFIPLCATFSLLMIPVGLLCFGVALIDTAILPTMGYLVDIRHTSVYGSIYAIADVSYSMAYAIGPMIAGKITDLYGFAALNVGIGVVTLLYCPLIVLLRTIYVYKPMGSEEMSVLMEEPPAKTFKAYMMNNLEMEPTDIDGVHNHLEQGKERERE
ncbi:PREDICTED: vesicular acetylcholine transporter-like, partial [Priapulus caudatus]|uniref:Vesicular acetylcholine transporter-like n=1 Tax=Priapulus caudatus TaxID=37621 RepID=A0ABM1F591_PRICU